MAQYKDSVGNTYDSLPKKPPTSHAKSATETSKRRSAKNRKDPNSKYKRYRAKIGKPRGPGKPGNKAGKNR